MLPLQPVARNSRAEHQMQNAPATGADRFRGRVNQQRAHDESFATAGSANDIRRGAPDCHNIVVWQTAEPMRARNHLERTISRGARLKMHAHGNQLLKKLSRCLDKE
jgi:hypothetical protein